jgi:carboxyl-terminal processing protease
MVPRRDLVAACFFVICAFALPPSPIHGAPGEQAENARLVRTRETAEFFGEIHSRIRDLSIIDLSPGDLVDWTVRTLYEHQREPLPDALDKRLAKVRDLNEAGRLLLFRDALAPLDRRRELKADALADQVMGAVLARFDRYARWNQALPFDDGVSDPPGGIGVELVQDARTGCARVVTPIKDGPAYKAGLRADDLITHVALPSDNENKSGEPQPTAGVPLDLLQAVLGEEGRSIRLTLRRPGSSRPVEVMVERGAAQTEPLLGRRRLADDSWSFWLDEKSKIGYVRLPNFGPSSGRIMDEFTTVLRNLKEGGLRGLVLDLRFNERGLWRETLQVANLFLAKGIFLTYRRPGDKDVSASFEEKGFLTGVPLVVLINGDSAKGSEGLAACLQDHKRAVIVGEKSRGKYSFQTVEGVKGRVLRLTNTVVLRPSGKKLDRISIPGYDDSWGVTPDAGQALILPPEERTELQEHLARRAILRHKDQPAPEDRFTDRQLELARRCVQDQLSR